LQLQWKDVILEALYRYSFDEHTYNSNQLIFSVGTFDKFATVNAKDVAFFYPEDLYSLSLGVEYYIKEFLINGFSSRTKFIYGVGVNDVEERVVHITQEFEMSLNKIGKYLPLPFYYSYSYQYKYLRNLGGYLKIRYDKSTRKIANFGGGIMDQVERVASLGINFHY